MDDEGLLKQFVEYTIGPIIAASFRQVKDERSWTKASMWSSIDTDLTRILTSCRGSTNSLTRQEILQEMESQCLETRSTAQGYRAKEDFCSVDARVGAEHREPTF